jgi:tetratricopeptide (TPR) repeat protein
VEALLHGKTQRAVDLSTEAIAREPSNPWAYYARANALTQMGRTESAIEDYDSAIALSGKDVWGRSVAIYGRARALDAADRCTDAARSYKEYARLVAPFEPELAANARQYSGYCVAASIDANAARQKVAAMNHERTMGRLDATPMHHKVAAKKQLRKKALPEHHKVAAVCPPTTKTTR